LAHMLQATACLLPAVGLVWLGCFHVCAHAAESVAAPGSYEHLIADLQARPQSADVAMQLGEAYFALGRSLQERERHAEALLAFDDALQLLRENRGLYELEQVPVLQARLDSSQALAEWRDVDAGRQLAYLITLKNPDAGSERRYQ